MAGSGCPAFVLSYGFAADVGSLMADDLVPFFQGIATSRPTVSLTDIILGVKWGGAHHKLVVDLEAREFSLVSTLPPSLGAVIEGIARGLGYAVMD